MRKNALPACTECGMVVTLGEYHPYAACLMYKGCKNEKTVRENLQAITTQYMELGQRNATHKWRTLIADDHNAITHQSMRQYRNALIKAMQEAS